MKTVDDRFDHAGIDYGGVYGGPPTRAHFYEARRAFIRGEKEATEIPVFGDGNFFSDIFKPKIYCSSAPLDILSSSDIQDGSLKSSSFSLPRTNHAGDALVRDDSFGSNVANFIDKEYKTDGRLPCSDSDCSEPEGTAKGSHFCKNERAGKRLSLATLLRHESKDNGKLQSCSSFNGWWRGESMRKLVNTWDRHFLSFDSDFSCSRGFDIDKEEEDFNFEGSHVREKFQKVKSKVLDGLSMAKPLSSRLSTGTSMRHTNRNTRRSSGMGCRFFDDVKNEDRNPIYEKNICERKIRIFNHKPASKQVETLKAASSFKTRAETNSHSNSKVSDSSISVDNRCRSPPILPNVCEGASDYDSDHSHFNVEELPDNGGSETEEKKIVEKVRSWSDGKEGNIRSLLSTLQCSVVRKRVELGSIG